jgi:hypothetical protein
MTMFSLARISCAAAVLSLAGALASPSAAHADNEFGPVPPPAQPPTSGVVIPPASFAPANIDAGNTNLGAIEGGLFLNLGGVDDKMTVKINGAIVLNGIFGSDGTFNISQTLHFGWNFVEVQVEDNQQGECWAVQYRIGDSHSWAYADSYSRCVPGNRGQNPVYKKTFSVYLS